MLKTGLTFLTCLGLFFRTVTVANSEDPIDTLQDVQQYSGQELRQTIGPQVSPHCIFSLPGATYLRYHRSQLCTCVALGRADCQPRSRNDTTVAPTVPSESEPKDTRPEPVSVRSTTTNRPIEGITTAKPLDRHPLDPLTEEEVLLTRQVILYAVAANATTKSSSKYIFNWITLREPPKTELLPYFLSNSNPPPGAVKRESYVVLIERITGDVYEAVVNLDTLSLVSFTSVPHGYQPSLSPEDLLNSEKIAKLDPNVQERCRASGYPNMSLVNADPWSMGYVGDRPEFLGKRLIQLYLYGKDFERDNPYPHPFDFLVVVDVIEEKVISIEDLPTHDNFDASNKVGYTVPKTPNNFDYKFLPPNFLRTDDKPIDVKSPKGPSYKSNGNEIQWQKFKMRIGFNGREGLVIYNVNYNDSGKVRPILYRAALSEMWIPYGDPRPPYHRKAVFDMGEYGIGFNTNELKPNQDCIGDVKYFDGILNNSTGDPVRYKNAICLREEDAGILWKHVDYRTGDAVVVRSHRLVLSFIATVGNYDYIFNWRFYQDGSIELKVQLTGILSINLLAVDATTNFGTVEFPQNYAQYHQHFFSVRLDPEIDGTENSVFTSETVSLPEGTGSLQNPYGQGFTTKRVELKTASEARTHISPLNSKVWIVSNPSEVNSYTKQPVGWKLVPLCTPIPLLWKDSPLRSKAGFMDYDVWVTRYDESQRFSGGLWLNNSGLPEWVQNAPDANVDDTDIVIWHNFGLTHVPRVEDYPVMPVESTGFWFKPYNFFLSNPGLDVPPPSQHSERTEL